MTAHPNIPVSAKKGTNVMTEFMLWVLAMVVVSQSLITNATNGVDERRFLFFHVSFFIVYTFGDIRI